MKTRKFSKVCIAIILVVSLLQGCSNANKSKTYTIFKDKKFNAVDINVSIERFIEEGFELGDSFDVVFSNGYEFKDIPFYNGYYAKTGHPLIVGYPRSDHLSITRVNTGLWDEIDAKEGDTITISLNTKGKYLSVQDSLSLQYSNSRLDFSSDNQFINARALKGGNLKENTFFRGASPINNENNRAYYGDQFLKNNNINFVLDLADNEEDVIEYMQDKDFNSPYALKLYEENKIVLLNMAVAFHNDDYKQKLAIGLREMLKNEGPVYIHCTEGKDRTGFVCFILEALAGCTYEEMQADYMKTYENYYGVTKESSSEKYEIIKEIYFNTFIDTILETEDIDDYSKIDYIELAIGYLSSCGLTQNEIFELKKYLLK